MIKEKLNTFKPRMRSGKSVRESESVGKNILGSLKEAECGQPAYV